MFLFHAQSAIRIDDDGIKDNTTPSLVWIEGYWRQDQDASACSDKTTAQYPFPQGYEYSCVPLDTFKVALKRVQQEATVQDYWGWSTCRLCGKINGSMEYSLTNAQGMTFRWPEGLMHYYVAHNVHPSLTFYNFIACYAKSLLEKDSLMHRRQKIIQRQQRKKTDKQLQRKRQRQRAIKQQRAR